VSSGRSSRQPGNSKIQGKNATCLRGREKIGRGGSGAFLIRVGRTDFTINIAAIIESALRSRLALLILLTVATQAAEGQGAQAFFRDFQTA
jgi:hypothetical protein